MSQIVNFTNPVIISSLQSSSSLVQGQVGTIAGQINNSSVANFSTINLTGSLYNSSISYFNDRYTLDTGLGPYQVDAIPICFNDVFPMPKFSRNANTTTGGAWQLSAFTGGSNNISFTTGTYDTFNASDIVVFAPSTRTGSLVTSLAFQQDNVNECNNLGGFGAPLQDWRGPFALNSTQTEFAGMFGSTGLGYAFWNFYNICSSGSSSSTGVRNTALAQITSHPDYISIKSNLKYPFKVWNQVKTGTGSFQYEPLYDLNGSIFTTTGADGTTSYTAQISSTTYSPTGNLLPIAQNVNATDQGKYGLLLMHLGDYSTTQFPTFAHQAASLGYIVVLAPQNPIAPSFCKYNDVRCYSKFLADSLATPLTSSSQPAASCVITGAFLCPNGLYNDSNDNIGAFATNGYFRLESRNNMATTAGSAYIERYFYLLKCVLNKLGMGSLIDYNNIVHMGISQGGQSLAAGQRLTLNSGNATQFKVAGVPPFLFKQRAMINYSAVFDEFSLLKNCSSTANRFNNRFALGINQLACPMVSILPDGDYGFSLSQYVFRFLDQAQTIYQYTKESTNYASDLNNYQKSSVFYKPVAGHFDHLSESPLQPGVGNADTMYDIGFMTDWLNGWHLQTSPKFPSLESLYESQNADQILASQLISVKIHNLIQFMAHRFLYSANATATSGRNFPIGPEMYPLFGLKYDVMPTYCDNITDYEYIRIGPTSRLTYDQNYNVVLSTYGYQAGSTLANQVSFIATGATGYFQSLSSLNDITASKAFATTFSGTNASFINATLSTGTVSYLNVASNLAISNTIATGTGAQTINKPAGQIIFGPADSSIVVTNNLVNTNSIIIATVATNDTTLKSVQVVAGSQQFTVYPNALATGNTSVNWLVINS